MDGIKRDGTSMKLLTIALGSGTTKAALWSDDGLIALGTADIQATHPRPGWVEEDPEGWWTSTISACAALPTDERLTVDAIVFSARRETFVVVTTAGGHDVVGNLVPPRRDRPGDRFQNQHACAPCARLDEDPRERLS